MESAALSSSASSAAAEVWRSLGMELAIFVVTLAFAFLIRGVSAKRAGGKQASTGGGAFQKVSLSSSNLLTKGSSDNLKKVAAPSPTEVTGAPRRALAEATGKSTLSPVVGRRQPSGHFQRNVVAQMLDEVVDGMREMQNMKFANRALSLYEDVRARLREDGARLPEVARCCRHSPLDFYTTVVHCAIRAGRQHLIESIIDDMCEQGVARPLAFYESTMKQLAGQKQYHLALSVYDRLAADGLQPSAVTCSCLIGFAAEVGELQRAVGFFERLTAMTTPSIRAYMTILRVHAKRQDWPSSLATLREMQNRGVGLDSLALNVALATGVAADRVEAVAALVTEADTYKPPISDVVSYNTLIKGYAQRGDPDNALQALERLKRRGLAPNAISFNTAMDAAVRGGRVTDAWRLLGEMREAGLQPDKYTCSILVKGLDKSPASERVRAALEQLCGLAEKTPLRTRASGRLEPDPLAILAAGGTLN